MEKIIRKKIENDKWETLILDGTKPPVTDQIRKQLKRLKKLSNKNDPPVNSSAPIIITFFFESGGKNLRKGYFKACYNYLLSKKKQEDNDENHDLNLLYDPPSADLPSSSPKSSIENLVLKQIDHIKMMTIDEPVMLAPIARDVMNVLAPITNNNRATTASSSWPNHDDLSDVILPLEDHELWINALGTSSNDDTNDLSGTNENDEQTYVDAYAINDLPIELEELHRENEIILDDYDKRIKSIQKQLKRIGQTLNVLVTERKKKQTELSKNFRERYRSWQEKK
ncbi:unnamed protein product [Rotaria magnacalcarata]|nr:unnamed protein product [Rotaria magnacalcarata]